jgi:rhamnose utilization protein RhaD (predicted bifunctional aldolase and dehydrogenase)
LHKEEAIVAAFRRDLMARLRQSLADLELDDLRDFALGLLEPDDEKAIDRFRQLKDDRSRLLASIQTRLHHLLKVETAA